MLYYGIKAFWGSELYSLQLQILLKNRQPDSKEKRKSLKIPKVKQELWKDEIFCEEIKKKKWKDENVLWKDRVFCLFDQLGTIL